jgi:peptidoglycan/xylan/chitin deacetylase (PgdA/CDA1 family)
VRLGQRVAGKLGRPARWVHDHVEGPSKVLVRVDEFPHYRALDDPERYGTAQFQRFHSILADAGVPYLIAALPALVHEPLTPATSEVTPLDDRQKAVLVQLASERVTVGLHGYDHRTLFASSRRHSEISGLPPARLEERLDRGEAVLTELGLPRPRVFVPPFNRFDRQQWPTLARRYDVICGGPESVREHGLWRTPSWRDGAVYLPAYAPLYGTARQVLAELRRRDQPGGWVPVVLHWGWEVDRGWTDLVRLADHLASCAVGWDDFLGAVETSR